MYRERPAIPAAKFLPAALTADCLDAAYSRSAPLWNVAIARVSFSRKAVLAAVGKLTRLAVKIDFAT